MAKAKKSEQDKAEGAKKPARRKATPDAAPKKESRTGAPSAQTTGVPLIDTNLAAAAAAKMLISRAASGAAPSSGAAASAASTPSETEPAGDKRETSAFKQLKQNLNKPQSGNLGSVLGGPVTGKKGNTPFGGNQQVARNQTFGADVNRSGVPRRTGG